MANVKSNTDGLSPYSTDAYDFTKLPDFDNDFVVEEELTEFARALAVPEQSPSHDDLTSPIASTKSRPRFITALNDWRPIHQRVRKRKRKAPRRGKDETREGFVYTLLKWPLLLTVFGWLGFLGVSYLLTRVYIFLYEHWITWRGQREILRRSLRSKQAYEEWVAAAKELDTHLGNDEWKKTDDYAYYDSKTIRRVVNHMSKFRERAEMDEIGFTGLSDDKMKEVRAVDELRGLVEASVKHNFVGFENARLYSESYYGTKDLVQRFIDEVTQSLHFLQRTNQLDPESKHALFKHIHHNFGRTALCLSGGATFAYYHFGVAKALLDAELLPEVITGTSGGALVAALLTTRTDTELKKLLVPALAYRITACQDATWTWMRRWWKTGARFDSIDWAARCQWFCRGSMTFREAYERTGRILNVSCVPSDPHSPAILANYMTAPDCVVWSAVLASAAVPGILNPVVLMKKTKSGKLEPYSFGHKWKDGSLRTDIPLKSLNLHFNVRFSIVSQVNPHINLFFFSSRGTVGRPVTHRRGRGWRGGFLGSATEQYIKLDLTKWLKVLRHLELLPRPLGQDWSEIWLQRFSGTITIWPKSIPSDFYNILTDPTPARLARMIHVGQQSAFPKLKFIGNRTKLERAIEEGRRASRVRDQDGMNTVLSEDDLKGLLTEARKNNGVVSNPWSGAETDSDDEGPRYKKRSIPLMKTSLKSSSHPKLSISKTRKDEPSHTPMDEKTTAEEPPSPALSSRLSNWWSSINPRHGPRSKPTSPYTTTPTGEGRPLSMFELRSPQMTKLYQRAAEAQGERRGSWVREMERQTRVFVDDSESDADNGPRPKSKKDEAETQSCEDTEDMDTYDDTDLTEGDDETVLGEFVETTNWDVDDAERERAEQAEMKYINDEDDA
ncbi:patatin-domain-containing protein [Pseudovirgaria hyperparasitica]|uniref:Patatin-domain-containing protein n=1 Tax=Pseudovirgaria hyperparasitica TaxID=470096 RepID=A0A6A6W1K0_9PEZI|nr:patatin-domain-containing protein [Pseudovirgaria hyperparasitica]KAF2756413.1 patatin-domain-containing protein [Pseudovirgaria hyperparasitica]